MCRSTYPKYAMSSDKIVELISRTVRKQRLAQDNLRLKVLLKSSKQLLLHDLRGRSKKKPSPMSAMTSDQIVDLIERTSRKQWEVQDDLRKEVLLQSTRHILKRELRRKERSSEKRWRKHGPKPVPSKKPVPESTWEPSKAGSSSEEDDAEYSALLARAFCLRILPWIIRPSILCAALVFSAHCCVWWGHDIIVNV